MIAALAAALIFALWVVGAPRLWRGEADVDDPSPAWPFGAATWRGVIRGFIVGPPCIAFALAGAAVAELTDADDLGMAIGVIGLVGFVVLHVPILLFNRPKALVPPPLRHQRGALREWRHKTDPEVELQD
jgi:hypothetical protein